jgi:hypothetical protein
MKPTSIKSFADLRAAIAAIAAEAPSVAAPPMTPDEVSMRHAPSLSIGAWDKRLTRLDVGNGADDPSGRQ